MGNPFLKYRGRPWNLDQVMSADYVRWAVNAAFVFVEEFVRAVGSTRDHHLLKHDEQP